MVDVELLKKLDIKNFTKIFNFLDKNFLKRKLIEYGKKQMKESKYYIGSRMGTFWNGFSKLDKIPEIKIKAFYKDEIKKENDDVIEIFNSAILHKLNISDDNREEIKDRISSLNDTEIATILFQLFHIDSNITYEQYVFEKNKIIEQYEEKIRKSEELYIHTISDMKDKNKNETEKVIHLTKDIEEKNRIIGKIEVEKDKYIKLYKEQVKKNNLIINSLSSKEKNVSDIAGLISNIIEKNNVENLYQLEEVCLEMLKSNVINFSNGNDITNNLILEYIIIKIMEEIKNGNTNN